MNMWVRFMRFFFMGRVGFVSWCREEVERKEDAVNEEFIGGEKVGLWERWVSEHPEFELR